MNKEAILEKLFRKQLDEAFERGVREGATYAMRTISFKVNDENNQKEMTKTQKIGYGKAVELITEAKHEVRGRTGAWV